MPQRALHWAVPVALAGVALLSAFTLAPRAIVVQPNDNTKPAGTMQHDTLRLRLVVQMADWNAESDTDRAISVAAVGEEGKAPQIPAPLVRVREGTIITATVRNALSDSAITLLGFVTHPSTRDSLYIKPGESRDVTFLAGAAGTYLYRARIGKPDSTVEREQTGGAFIVDPPGGSPPDRIFVINIWGQPIDSASYSNAVTINGRSWPWTERIQAVVGDTMHWRVVNASARSHPMHLHGAYFSVNSKGGIFRDTTYTTDQRRLGVTEEMRGGQTMNIAWSPVREGRWIFHCHLIYHVIPTAARVTPAAHGGHDEGSMNPAEHMAGLVIGIDARLPKGVTQAARLKPRVLDLYVQEGKKRGRADRTLSFVLQRDATPPAPDSTEVPGSLLVLTRDEPVDVVVHNRLKEGTAIHWHGLELESYSDGVAGYGGSAAMPSPAIAAGGTFTAHLTMPRAGTFIYHTHLRDEEQLTSGMYGGIIVMEPGKVFDPRTDHVHVLGWDSFKSPTFHFLVNGDSVTSPPIEMAVGETHRLRFINIGAAGRMPVTLKRDTTLAEWLPIAKDGADLPPAQRVAKKALLLIDVGETYDFTFAPTAPGEYVLSTVVDVKGAMWKRRIIVR